MSDERVWLRHTEHGGAFHAPVGAVEAWAQMGWVPGEPPPPEPDPAVVENLAAQAAAEQIQASTQTSRSKTPPKE